MFCSVVSKLGSKIDRKRCLFEYQSIQSRTKDYLHIDEFNVWLINSKVLKFKVEKHRPASASMNRVSNLAVGIENSQRSAFQKQTSQAANTVFFV
jgi:hypothetical protein